MFTRISCTICTAILLASLLGCAASSTFSHPAFGQRRAGEPDALVRVQTNLTKPLSRELLPNSITDASGGIIASITDAQYCGPNTKSARLLAQITRGSGSPAASNLLRADCTAPLSSVVSRHKSAVGFSGVLELTVAWTSWTLTRTVANVAPVTPTTFTAPELSVIQHYSSQISTDRVQLNGNNSLNEAVALAFGFFNETIAIGVFQGTSTVSADWADQASGTVGPSVYTNNAQVAVSHSFLQTLLSKYESNLTFSTTINGTTVTFDNLFEATLPLNGVSVTGIRFGADGSSSSASFCKIHITTDWSGTPLVFQTADAVGAPPQGFCAGLATIVRNEVNQKLQNEQFVSGTARDFNISLGNQSATLHFVGADSAADDHYLSIFGNGGVDVH
jgi:hypothetical protein